MTYIYYDDFSKMVCTIAITNIQLMVALRISSALKVYGHQEVR